MTAIVLGPGKGKEAFYRWAIRLSAITVFYNLVEGVVSVFFGLEDGAFALFGFGLDSFVEIISGIGIWHMTLRMRRNGKENADNFEKTALKATGTAFYILTIGLSIAALVNIVKDYRPETTLWGVIVSSISIMTMWLLMHYKMKIGRQYNSNALMADASCTKTCIYLSVVLLVVSIGYELTGIGLLDSLGAAGIAIFSFKEGREAFGKAQGKSCGCGKTCAKPE